MMNVCDVLKVGARDAHARNRKATVKVGRKICGDAVQRRAVPDLCRNRSAMYSTARENAIILEKRTRKNEHGFSFLEAVKVHITRIPIFLQTKNAQTRTDS